MICSKCKFKLGEEDNICPKCGKLVKEECPRCATPTHDKVCPKCKLTLVKKCFKCSQTNHIMQDTCIRCKTVLKTYEHLTLFASLSLEIQNIEIVPKKEELKKILQGIGLYLKDDSKEKNIGFKHVKKNIFVLKFYNANTLKESSLAAIKYAFEMVRFLESLNESIHRRYKKKFKIRVGLSISNRFDRRNLSRTEQAININDEIYIIGNSYIVQHITDAKIEHLISLPENNRVNKIYKIIPEIEETQETKKVKESILYELDEEKEPKVKLELEKYTQENIEQVGFEAKLYKILQEDSKYRVLNIETDLKENKYPYIDLHKIPLEMRKTKFCKLKCSKKDIYTPFSFIKNVVASFYSYSLLNTQNADVMNSISLKELYKLLHLDLSVNTNLDEMKLRIWDEFKSFLMKISKNNKVVFIVEDFDLIDKSSLECLNDVIETDFSFDGVKFVLFTQDSQKFLTQDIPVLLDKDYFLNITLKKSSHETLSNLIKKLGVSLNSDYLFQNIFKNSKGSYSYLMHCIKYLESINAIDFKDGRVNILEENLITLPFLLEEVIQKRLDVLSKRKDLYEFFVKLVLISDSFKVEDIKAKFSFDGVKYVKTLVDLGFMTEVLNSGVVIINNYNIISDYIYRVFDKKDIEPIIGDIVTKTKTKDKECLISKFSFVDILEEKPASKVFYDYAYACIALGDINAARSCFDKFIEIVGGVTKNKAEFFKVKTDIYKTIIMLSIDFNYDLACDYIQKSLGIIKDKKAVIDYYFLLVQASFCAEKYKLTKEYIAKLFNLVPSEVFDIYSQDFDINFYNLRLIETKVLYYTGETKKAIEQADDIIQTFISLRKTPNYATDTKFKNILDNSIAEALVFKSLSQLLQNDLGFTNTLNYLNQENSKVFSTGLLKVIYDSYKNLSMQSFDKLEKYVLSSSGNLLEKNTAILVYLYVCMQVGYLNKALEVAFKLKKQMVYSKQVKLFFDLIIVDYHINLGLPNRAKELLEEVIESAKSSQLNLILYISWILLSRIEVKKGNIKEACDVLNKSNVIMQEHQNRPKLFSILFKRELAIVLLNAGSHKEAKIPLEMALSLADANGYDYFKIDAGLRIIEILQKELHSEEDPIYRNQIEIELQNILNFVQKSIEGLQNQYLKQKFARFLQAK